MRAQTFDEIITILKSLPSVKDVVISVKSELFGVEWAKSDQCTFQTYEGTCAGWKQKNEILMVKWPGYSTNKQVKLESLEKDTDGNSLDLKLLDYEDGRPAPILHIPPPPRAGAQGPGDLDSDGDGDDGMLSEHSGAEEEEEAVPDKFQSSGQHWRKRDPQYVKATSRRTRALSLASSPR